MIWNPWKALRAAEQEIARLREIVASDDARLDKILNERDEVRSAEREVRLRATLAETRIKQLEAELAKGHFRNPKTGRLGRKGERFK